MQRLNHVSRKNTNYILVLEDIQIQSLQWGIWQYWNVPQFILVVSDVVLVVSMSRACLGVVAWVTENNFVVECRMTIPYCSLVSFVDSTHFHFYNLDMHVFFLSRVTTGKNSITPYFFLIEKLHPGRVGLKNNKFCMVSSSLTARVTTTFITILDTFSCFYPVLTNAPSNCCFTPTCFSFWYMFNWCVPDLYLVVSCLTVFCCMVLPLFLAHSLMKSWCKLLINTAGSGGSKGISKSLKEFVWMG